MTISEIKQRMLNYTDFYGGDIIGREEIRKARTKKQLADIIEKHRHFMEDMLSDAISHLDHFKKEMKLTIADGVC